MSAQSVLPRLLMMAGAPFVHSLLFRYGRYLRGSLPCRCSALLFETPDGRPDETNPASIFDEVHLWPQPVSAPRSAAEAFRVGPHLLRGALGRGSPDEFSEWRLRLRERATESLNAPYYRSTLSGYHLYHWHGFMPDMLPALRFLPANANLILTLWGSDLFRTAGVWAYARQLEACRRATRITMASQEMRQAFLAKFGREWDSKLRVLNYGACNLGAIPAARTRREDFLKRNGIDPNRYVICVGNNASAGNRHVEILRAIRSLNPELLRKVELIVPMTYGQTPAYMDTVRRETADMPCPTHVFDRFLALEDTAALRAAADITIHVPITDQLSASLCEALYAGSVVITGSWLPYSPLRLNGLHFRTIDDLSELTGALTQVLSNYAPERSRAEAASPGAWKMMAWESVIPRWLDVYREIWNERPETQAFTGAAVSVTGGGK